MKQEEEINDEVTDWFSLLLTGAAQECKHTCCRGRQSNDPQAFELVYIEE